LPQALGETQAAAVGGQKEEEEPRIRIIFQIEFDINTLRMARKLDCILQRHINNTYNISMS
jgi:hypothetical protein